MADSTKGWSLCFTAWRAMSDAGMMDGEFGSEWRLAVIDEFGFGDWNLEAEVEDEIRVRLNDLLFALLQHIEAG